MRTTEGAVWVRFPRFIGDAVMIHLALEPLRASGQALVAWGPSAVMDLFEGSGAFDHVEADPPKKPGAWALAKLLRSHRPAAILNLPRSQRASAAGFLARVPLRVGWSEGPGRLLNNRCLSFRGTRGHQMDRYGALLGLGFPGLAPSPPIPFQPRPEAQAEADRLLEGVSEPFIAFALGAACWNKRLGRPVWTALARLLREQGRNVVLLGAPGEDQVLARQILAEVPGLVDLTGRASLAVVAGLLRRSEGLVGNDSALAHLAMACGRPTVVAFGPTDPAVTAPLGAHVRRVQKEGLSCLPCGRMDCTVDGHPCMQALEADRLFQALDEARASAPAAGAEA